MKQNLMATEKLFMIQISTKNSHKYKKLNISLNQQFII